jgi:folate-binding protein YgfZ
MSDAPIIEEKFPDLSSASPATPLAAALNASNAVPLLNYRGAQTMESFSNAPEELAALLNGVGVFDLGWRSFLRCCGEDRVRWLNGMVTNSITDLAENAGCYGFVLNSQGRIQGDLDIYRRADSLWLETDRNQMEPLRAFLDHYIIMDDVTLEPEERWTAIGVVGPRAAEKLAAAGLLPDVISPMHLAEISWQGCSVAIAAAHSPLVPRFEIWIPSKRALDLWNALIAVNAVPCGATAVEQLRILEGTLAYGVDISNRDLPQETNQMRALHFAKGCYLGQEIVERIRSRGLVHRTFAGFLLEAEVPAKTALIADEQPVGELTTVTSVMIPQSGERTVALGRIRKEALDRKARLTAAGIPATASALPFDFARAPVQP